MQMNQKKGFKPQSIQLTAFKRTKHKSKWHEENGSRKSNYIPFTASFCAAREEQKIQFHSTRKERMKFIFLCGARAFFVFV